MIRRIYAALCAAVAVVAVFGVLAFQQRTIAPTAAGTPVVMARTASGALVPVTTAPSTVHATTSSSGVATQSAATTGGTGPAPRDVTPEATLAVADKEMPGFGEQMRQISLRFVPTAILSRQVAVIRHKSLIINLPGQPKSIAETLQGLPDATPPVPGIFAAVPYCVDLIGGPYIETDPTICKAFRPKSALRA